MNKGIHITDFVRSIRKRKKRGGSNFSVSRQRQRRELKRKESLGAEGSMSPRKPSESGVEEQGRSWRLGCKIWALDLEPIEDELVQTDGGSEPQILMAKGLEELIKYTDITRVQTDSEKSDAKSDMLQSSGSSVSVLFLDLQY